MKKVLVIVGPTAIGKTGFGIELAKKLNGEIISGDSIQVYRKLDIGSGKVTAEETDGIIHHGIDILDADENYSVYDFQKMARHYINEISNKGKLPIIVGGTGLYIKACLYDYNFEQGELNLAPYQDLTNEQLYERLKVADPNALNTIHINNRKRLIRALAMAYSGNAKSVNIENQKHELLYDAFILGLTDERDVVYQRINYRVDVMVKHGLIEEIQGLLDDGITFENQSMQGIGYREFANYYNKTQNIDEVIELIKRNTRRFAKRQYTWFNNQTPIKWYNLNEKDQAIKDVEKWNNMKD